jgi:hypothetical protein
MCFKIKIAHYCRFHVGNFFVVFESEAETPGLYASKSLQMRVHYECTGFCAKQLTSGLATFFAHRF